MRRSVERQVTAVLSEAASSKSAGVPAAVRGRQRAMAPAAATGNCTGMRSHRRSAMPTASAARSAREDGVAAATSSAGNETDRAAVPMPG